MPDLLQNINFLQKLPYFDVDTLQASFAHLDPSELFTERHFQNILESELSSAEGYQDGMRLTLAAAPCDVNGCEFTEEDYKQWTPHILVLKSDGRKPVTQTDPASWFCSGVGIGLQGSLPLLKVFPAELVDQCSLVIDYSNPTDQANPKEYFERELLQRFQNLSKLVIG